jgi:hypothetical protein
MVEAYDVPPLFSFLLLVEQSADNVLEVNFRKVAKSFCRIFIRREKGKKKR